MRKKGEIKRKYPFLKTVFKDWHNKKLSEIESSKKLDAPPKDFLERLGLNEDEFYDMYILPFENLSKGELEIVFNLLAPTLMDRYTDLDVGDDCELSLIYDITYSRKKNALDWLLFHVYLLNIFDIHKKVDTPYLQCFYCGKPDSYKRNGVINIICHGHFQECCLSIFRLCFRVCMGLRLLPYQTKRMSVLSDFKTENVRV